MKPAPLKEGNKRSLRAKLVARDVIKNVRSGKQKTFKEIALKYGYSLSSIASNKVQKTKSYQEEIAPMVAQMNRILIKAYSALEEKNLSKDKSIDVANISKILQHDSALLLGKSTENVSNHTEVIVYSPNDPLARQLNGSVEPKTEDTE